MPRLLKLTPALSDKIIGYLRAGAYCDTDRTDRDARLVVHSHHVCLIVGDDPEPRLRHERLLRSAQDLTRGAREYEEQRWS